MIEINPDVERLIAVLADRAVATEALTEADWDRPIGSARYLKSRVAQYPVGQATDTPSDPSGTQGRL